MRNRLLLVLLNYWPFVHVTSGVAMLWHFRDAGAGALVAGALAWIYLLPPLLCRLVFLVLGKPKEARDIPFGSRDFFVWWFSLHLQVIYLRLPFLEELLRFVPGLYSGWLRLWGGRVGKFIYWSPALQIMDRPYLDIGDFAMLGYGFGMTAHHTNFAENGELSLVLASPRIGARAMMGGLSGLAPGAEVAEGEVLPSTMQIAPFYLWQGGRRHARRS